MEPERNGAGAIADMPREPSSDRLRGEVLVRDVAGAGLPPASHLVHRGQGDVADGRLHADGLARAESSARRSPTGSRRMAEIKRSSRRSIAFGTRRRPPAAHDVDGLPRRMPAGDLVPQGPQQVDLGGRIASMSSVRSLRGGVAVAPLPRAERRDRDAEQRRDGGDGESGLRPRFVEFARRLHRSIVTADPKVMHPCRGRA